MCATGYKTPDNTKFIDITEKRKGNCRRKLYSPKTKTLKQIKAANGKVTHINRYLLELNNQSTTASKRHLSMLEYRYKLKIATAESVKCMYLEYIERKCEKLSSLIADRCYKDLDLSVFISPVKQAASVSPTD